MQKAGDPVSRIGILVGGGPAPGINSAISSAALKAIDEGYEVIGIYDGFSHLIDGRTDMVRSLTAEEVSRIHGTGGSILRTSRANPTRSPEMLARAVGSLDALGITRLVTIGGDDTAFGAREIAAAAEGRIRVAHVPKTIDNDLPLPGDMPTFGFETARDLGSRIAQNLMEDSRATSRWFFVTVMGRKAGHLALGIGKSAGATVTVIPEEFTTEPITVDRVCTILEGAILKRRVLGRPDGLIVLAEGLGEKMDPEELARMPGVEVEYDSYGHLRLAEIPLETILRREVQRRFAARGESVPITDLRVGYELRCAPPVPFDVDYTRTLGYGAARFLLADQVSDSLKLGGIVTLSHSGHLSVRPFEEFRDPDTGRTAVRLVEIDSEDYRVARQYMLRLETRDLEDPEMLEKLAREARMEPGEFVERFAGAVNGYSNGS
ncbi:MAG: 6-phosphofructokinase [marine benthic group bacterium]|jgi:6-phosphofructokinase 1|nr:6-phosphofructokinase [Gemmatimonadota bacterium]MCL7961291.1 6-phosphofructokinase [Candidatus Carthagonibacter metallireducens]MCL7936600.1 6-phosphofructokinase [Gemmatimonadota bacterium]MCL7957343.1 6-phosphofructokinase [Gemmatimonadota bacterium]MCL7964956.1 6-phosphofructokinase [Gemmatimonadota bacterium]